MTEVGSVSVRVIPDTTRFRKELEAKLKALDDKMEITFGANTERIREEVEKATRNLPDGKVKVDVDQKLINSALDDLRKKLRQAGEVNLDATPEIRAGWREELQAELDAAKALTLDADLASEGVRQRLAAVLAELQTAAILNPVEIPVQLETRGFRNALSGIGSGAMSGLAGVFEGISNVGAKPVLLIGALAAAATLAAPALALVAGSLTLIPAAIAGYAAPIGAVILGLDGIKKAAEDAGLTGTETGKRGAVKTTVGQQLAELKKQVSGTFATELVKPFQKLNDIIPKLTAPMQTVAQGLSSMADGFISSITSVDGMKRIQDSITNIGLGLKNAGPGVKSFTDGLLGLVDKVAQRFPGMGEGFSKLGDQFSGWVTKFTTPDAVTGVSKLDETLKSLKSTWDQVSGLGGDLLKQGFAWISDPNFGASMQQFFSDVRQFITGTLPLLASGFKDAVDVINGLSGSVKWVNDLASSFERITGAAPKTEGPLQKEGFMGLFGKDGVIGDQSNVNMWWQVAFGGKTLAEAQAAAQAAGQSTGAAVKNGMDAAMEAAATAKMNLAGGGGDFDSAGAAQAAVDAVKAQIGGQMQAVIAEANASIAQLGPSLQTAIDAATAPLVQLPTTIGTTFGTLGAAVGGAWGAIVQNVTTGANQIVTAITSSFAQIPAATTGAFGTLVTSIQGPMTEAVTAVTNGGVLIQAELSSWPGKFQAAVGDLGGALVAAGGQLVQGLVNGINANKGAAVAAAAAMANEVAAASKGALGIKSPSRVFMEIGDNVGQGFVDGIQAKQDAVTKQATQLADAATAAAQGSIKMGGVSLGINTGGLTDQRNALKVQQEQTDLQIKQLMADKAMGADKSVINGQLAELKARQASLAVQKEQLDLAGKQGAQSSEMASTLDSTFNTMTKMPMDFAMANSDQFMSDIGMGGGAITEGLRAGIGLASNYIFNVSGIGEALTAKNTLTNKAAVGIVGR